MVDTSPILETPWTVSNLFRNKSALFGRIDAKDFGLSTGPRSPTFRFASRSRSHDADELDKHNKHDTVGVFQEAMILNRELSFVVDDKKCTIANPSNEAAVHSLDSPPSSY